MFALIAITTRGVADLRDAVALLVQGTDDGGRGRTAARGRAADAPDVRPIEPLEAGMVLRVLSQIVQGVRKPSQRLSWRRTARQDLRIDGLNSRQVGERVEQHRAVAGGEHDAVTEALHSRRTGRVSEPRSPVPRAVADRRDEAEEYLRLVPGEAD